jgi:hypothetical protein
MSKYVINKIGFNTKNDVVKFIQSILYKYNEGEFLDKIDFNFVYDLLSEGHHNPDRKIGSGVAGIFVGTNNYNRRGFFIKRLDGSITDFSYRKCIYKKGPLHDIKSACRTAIREDIIRFRENFFKENADADGFIICPFTHQKVSIDNCHIDHIPPNTFNKIFSDWIRTKNIDPKKVKLLGYGDGDMTKKFIDEKLKNSFIKFHRERMNLRVTSPLGNLSGSKLENRRYD